MGSKSLAGQSSVEYALVTAALIAIIIALGALMNLWESGAVVDHGLSSASHAINASVGWIADVFSY